LPPLPFMEHNVLYVPTSWAVTNRKISSISTIASIARSYNNVLEWFLYSCNEKMENTMRTLDSDSLTTVAPSEADAKLARESSRQLATYRFGNRLSVAIQLLGDGKEAHAVSVPVSALRLFFHILTEMAEGNSVTLIPTHAELTTQQAADVLNVSRPYVVKLLDEGQIPCRTVGKYRRVRFVDLMAYKRKDDEARAKVLDELAAQAQELYMGY